MSQYKSAIRSQQPPDTSVPSQYRVQARQLQELFPNWSSDDLLMLLVEVNGDVQLAATRISDGVADQWGSVSRKKDKKAPAPTTPSRDAFPGRGDSRGGRGGGRGGRGGLARGGATASRGRGGPPRGGATNGHISRTDTPRVASTPAVNGSSAHEAGDADAPAKLGASESHDAQNGHVAPSVSGGTDSSSLHPDTSTVPTSASTSTSAWDGPSTASTRGGDTVNSASTSSAAHTASVKPATKTPANSKLSWAQIAKPHEKPTPAPPAPVQQHPPSTPAPAPQNVAEEQPAPEPTPESPTTAQAPTWDDEPAAKVSTTTADSWPPTQEPTKEETKTSEPEPQAAPESKSEELEKPTQPAPEAISETKAEPLPPAAAPAASPLPAQLATPSPKLSARPAASHRTSARYKVTDQPVVMPSSFGAIEKVGMQFGSLSLGGESLFESSAPAEPEEPSTASLAPEPASPAPAPVQAKHEATLAPPPATAPASSISSVFSQQQMHAPQQPQPAQPQQHQNPITHHISPAASQSTQTPAHLAAAASPIQQFAQQQQSASQQQSLANIHQQQQQQPLPQQVQQSHHSYAQHGLPTHIDPSQQVQPPTQQQQLQSAAGVHSNYFRQSETASSAPYFHTPTPPAGQSQDAYTGFSQLAQGQHQQGSHLGGFGSADYGYGENQRGFYDSYAQQTGFGNRNALGHEDVKGLPGAQPQPPSNAGLPPTSAQSAQQHSSSQAANPQPTSGQGPQQYPPPPVPYYYTPHYPQNQYYGAPYSSGYGVPQPYMKYPTTVFQAGLPGPGSAPSPAAKQPGANVGVNAQPQTNPYSQGLYQQGGYDDYQHPPHHSQHQQHQQHSHSLGLGQGGVGVGSGEYGKQLYGGAGQGGMQGFMGLGGQSSAGGAGASANGGGPRASGSPETNFKSYVPKDTGIGVSAGRGGSSMQQQGGQVQGQPQGQGPSQAGQGGPQGQGFYGTNRFGGANSVAGVGAGNSSVGGPQQSQHHQQVGPQGHLGFPQGGNDAAYYSYQQQQRQQGGYW